MRHAAAIAIGTGALLGALSFTPTMAEILIQSGDDDDEVHIMIDRESPSGRITREYIDGQEIRVEEEDVNGHIVQMVIDDGDTVSTCVRLEADNGERPLACISDDSDGASHRYFASSDQIGREIEESIRDAMRDLEREMALHEREMAEFERTMDNFEWEEIYADIAAAAVDVATMAENLEETIMTSLAESGIRMESDGEGNETVWIEAQEDDEPSMRVVSTADGQDLVFMYFDGFDNPYHFVIEDDDDSNEDGATIHAYDVASVEIVENSRRRNDMNADTDDQGRPHLTVHTDHPDQIHVIPLDRRRFGG